ncbi:lysM domain receptor-like kinase 4 [Actinidia eriantha]|uniref:lysM domain receptor-like kinase 4 n=1 Tax=Actinidia eriantha TaxID=165200 RepID=UPI00258BCB0F|nr:lysM domain receptor-like kinase 4 [Actinidia eriantha]
MDFLRMIYIFSIFLITFPCLIQSQQPYVGKATTRCSSKDNSTSAFGYTCNGLNRTCQSYLTFRTQFPYNSVSSISELLGTDPSQLSQLNSVDDNATFETDKTVLVPVKCSCSGEYYQANISYVVQRGNTYFVIANNTFQGLSTCQALRAQNSNLTTKLLYIGNRLVVPLRCACPTKSQVDVGVNYLLSYLVTWGQSVSIISLMFGVDTGRTLEANQISEDRRTIYPFTTLLVPLQNPPSSSQTVSPPPPPRSPPPPPPPQHLSSPNHSSNKTWAYVAAGALGGGSFVLLAGIIVFFMFFRRSTKRNGPILPSGNFEAIEKPREKKSEEESEEFLDSISAIAQSLKVYTYQELQSATENFSPSCWIKGSVYCGTINGDSAAIKKMNGDVSKEIEVLNKISHFNLILLSGVCFHEGQWYLVYEYAVNGSLSDWIYHENSDQKFLNWTQRIQIALDVATGLNYIHNYTSPPYVHKDLKTSNVLIDSDFRAKIANFGLARSAEGHEGQFNLTKHIVGTKGYMAPEYLENGFVSTKLDVYAFGVLMLEILTGKEVTLLYEGVNKHLSEVLLPVLHEENGNENLYDFMDPSLQGNYPAELAILVAKLADCCIARDPAGRPGMDEVVQSLSRIVTTSLSWEQAMTVSRMVAKLQL